jgi:cytochrome P450
MMDGVPPGEWGPAAEVQLCYEIKTFVLAGHETSAAMLTWSLFELSRNPVRLAAQLALHRALTCVFAGHRGQSGGRGDQGVW